MRTKDFPKKIDNKKTKSREIKMPGNKTRGINNKRVSSCKLAGCFCGIKKVISKIKLPKFLKAFFERVKKHVAKNYQAYRWGSIAVSVLGVLLILYPFVPELIHRLFPPDATESPYRIENPDSLGIDMIIEDRVPEENRLVIPKIGVNAEILEGKGISVLSRKEGVWRDPSTKKPTEEGNMVLSGHRFQYLPPNLVTLYNLNKIEKGDIAIVYWEGQEYDYKVTKTFSVEPADVWIKNSIPGKTQLTIYTCTPLWSNTHRLVVVAELLD